MARYSIQIEIPGSNNNQYQQLNAELKKETGKKFKLFSAKPVDKLSPKAEYDVEGNISIQDLGSLISGITTKINKDYSFTILRQKVALSH